MKLNKQCMIATICFFLGAIFMAVTFPVKAVAAGDCNDPIPLISGDTVEGNTIAAENNTSGSCAVGDAGELVYKFDAADGDDVSIKLEAEFDAYFYIRKGNCASGFEISCEFASSDWHFYENIEADTYYLFVDGYAGGDGEVRGGFSLIYLNQEIPENNPPIADTGEDLSKLTHNEVQLDGSESTDPDGGPIVCWEWSIVWDEENGTAPAVFGASISNSDTQNPVFNTGDYPGEYTLSLVVTDNRGAESEPDFVTITVTDAELEGDHADADGIPDSEEMGPDGTDQNFDGNDDSIPDWKQYNVSSFHSHDNTGYVTMDSGGGTYLSDIFTSDGTVAGGFPSENSFPFHFFGFTINVEPGSVTAFMLFLPEGTVIDSYFKFGPTPDNPDPHWYEFLYDGETGAEIDGTRIIVMHFVDGKRGDDDLTANGKIVDIGGPSISSGSGGCFISAIKK